MNIRRLTDKDWDTLVSWWSNWPKWKAPVKDFLPENGKGGLIVEINDTPVVAGFIYLTNSKTALLEWIVSNPKYRESDRKAAIELLITGAENLVKSGIGTENVKLTDELRQKSVGVFLALSWACLEGSK